MTLPMAVLARRPRRTPPATLAALLAAAGAALRLAFVAPGGARRRVALVGRASALRDSQGREFKDPMTFNAADASQVAASHTVEFGIRPFGVTAYAPSTDGRGAVVWEMHDQSRYPGDAQGQAWVSGVKRGFAIKSVAGRDVSSWDFWDIMDLLSDKKFDYRGGKYQGGARGSMGNQPAALPVTVEFAELRQQAPTIANPNEVHVDHNDPRYHDLPRDATLLEYKIPRAPAKYKSATVEAIRSYVASLPEPVGYSGPRYTTGAAIDDAWLTTVLNNFKEGKLLPMKDAYRMVLDAFDINVQLKSLGRVQVPEGKKVTVVGDIHGQLFDFSHMLSLTGFPSAENQFVFNGDFVDRGPWSVEVMLMILAFKLRNPDSVFMNRGNHEAEMANTFYGFFGEVEVKYEKQMCDLFAELFRSTPLCHVLNDEVFVVHGGIPGPDPRVWWKDIDNQISIDGRQIQIGLAEIEDSDRFMEPNPNENSLLVDLLWSDPKGRMGYGPSGRMSTGIYLFGPDISRNFMEFNKLRMIIRSHEVKASGYRYDHEGQFPVITVFSAPNYVDRAGNLASVAVLTNTAGRLAGPEFVQYQAQPHPDIPSGAYAAGGLLHPDNNRQPSAPPAASNPSAVSASSNPYVSSSSSAAAAAGGGNPYVRSGVPQPSPAASNPYLSPAAR